MKLNFTIVVVLKVTAPLGKNLRPSVQKSSDFIVFRKTKSCRQHAILVVRLTLLTSVLKSERGSDKF